MAARGARIEASAWDPATDFCIDQHLPIHRTRTALCSASASASTAAAVAEATPLHQQPSRQQQSMSLGSSTTTTTRSTSSSGSSSTTSGSARGQQGKRKRERTVAILLLAHDGVANPGLWERWRRSSGPKYAARVRFFVFRNEVRAYMCSGVYIKRICLRYGSNDETTPG